MKLSFAITWDGVYRNLMVATCPNFEDAKVAVDNSRSDGGIAVAIEADLSLPGPSLVGLYNAIAALANTNDAEIAKYEPVTRFATRSDGQRRIFALLEENFKNAPKAAVPTKVEDESAAKPETETKENDVATKDKKTKKTKAAPAAKPKKAKGKALVRENSSFGRALKYGVDGTKTLAQITALVKLKDNGRNPISRVKFRLKKVAGIVGGTFEFDEKTNVASIKLPKGTTLESIFGAA